jgi:hypothetical protein
MTKSYIDGFITIPAAANRDGRQPRSMVLRAKNPVIYDDTVTAQVYEETRPRPHIIADTEGEGEDYAELYDDQKERIQSSIIYPVLSDTHELLGTLVVHCNKKDFFSSADARYWTDLLEVFEKRLALIKKRMDWLKEAEDVTVRLDGVGQYF